MKYLKLPYLSEPIKIEQGGITLLEFLDSAAFFDLFNALSENNDEKLLFSDDFTHKLDIKKKFIFLPDVFTMSLSDKKNCNALYKIISKDTSAYDSLLCDLKDKLNALMNNVKREIDGDFTFDDDLGLNDLLSLCHFRYSDSTSIFSKLISILKFFKNIVNFDVLFTIDIFKYFDTIEIEIFKNELFYSNSTRIDFYFCKQAIPRFDGKVDKITIV